MSAVKVRLVGGYQTCSKRQCDTVFGLGLFLLGDERVLADTPAIRGMIARIPHLLKWEKIDGNPPPPRKRRRRVKREKSAAAS
jgi:large subunit ribosomal protein L30